MTKLEKMAKDFEDNRVKEECICTIGDGECCEKCSPSEAACIGIYIAGFKAAREMAQHHIKIVHKGSWTDKDNYWDLLNFIESMGEEEV